MLVGHESEANITALAYQARGFLLASAALDGKVLLWQPTSRRGSQVGEFQFQGGEASVLAWAPDDTRLAAAGCLCTGSRGDPRGEASHLRTGSLLG